MFEIAHEVQIQVTVLQYHPMAMSKAMPDLLTCLQLLQIWYNILPGHILGHM